jgi:hypothetical protein
MEALKREAEDRKKREAGDILIHAAADKTLIADKSAPEVEVAGSRLEGGAVGAGDVMTAQAVEFDLVAPKPSLADAVRKEMAEEGVISAVEVEVTQASPAPTTHLHEVSQPAAPAASEGKKIDAAPATESPKEKEKGSGEKRPLSLAELQALTDLTQISAVSTLLTISTYTMDIDMHTYAQCSLSRDINH